MSNQINAAAVCDLATLQSLKAELSAKRAALKQAQDQAEWDQKTAARNPAFVPGSCRKPTEADVAALGHTHGLVCEIRCEACGKTRVVNKQDAFQVRFCQDCRKEASKAAGREKRLEKRLAGVSREDLEAQIAELNALLATK